MRNLIEFVVLLFSFIVIVTLCAVSFYYIADYTTHAIFHLIQQAHK